MLNRIIVLLMAIGLIACVDTIDPLDDGGAAGKPDTADSAGGKEDAWNSINDPEIFSTPDGFNYNLSELPLSGRSAIESWPSTYWPTYENGIVNRWQGRTVLSPAEQYDAAFNGWTPSAEFASMRPFEAGNCDEDHWDSEYYDNLGPLASYLSDNMGNKEARDGVDSDGDGDVDECNDHDGVQTWFGLCHAWVPASVQEARPLRAVEYNGQTFQVGDMEALLILAYNRSSASLIGGRCNLFATNAEMASIRGCRLPDVEAAEGDTMRECSQWELDSYVVSRDDNGRIEQSQCNDTNPGSFHVIMANFLGLAQQPFAYDQTYNYEVWNQPVVAFNVSKLEEVTPAQANALLGEDGDTYTHNDDAATLYEVRATSTYITESQASTVPNESSRYERTNHHTYILEVDAAGLIIGGEWFGASVTDHPDFLWDTNRRESSSVQNLNLDNVRMLVQMSRSTPSTGGGGDTVTVAGQGGLSIPDNNMTGITATATVSDSITVAGVRVELDVTHTYVGDLKIELEHNGVRHLVRNQTGGSNDDINETIDVTGFDGAEGQGTWTLIVSDRANLDTGTLNAWTLHLVPASGGGDTGGGDTGTVGDFSNNTRVDIPDNNPTGASSTINVTDEGTVGEIEVAVVIRHTYIGDLKVTLSHGGVDYTLHANVGGGADDIDKSFTVAAFDGLDAKGQWVLKVVDNAGQDVGYIDSWTIEIGEQNDNGTDTGGGDTTGPQVFPGGAPMSIPDNNPTGVTSEAGIPAGLTGTVQARVNITHTWRGDLKVVLSHSGQQWVLHDKEGGSADNLEETFNLSPAPQGDIAGTWTLQVSDNASQDLGTLDGWNLVVTP